MDDDKTDSALAVINKDAPFYYYLGEFICAYATAENYCHFFVRDLAKFNERIGRAVTGGMRMSDVLNLMKRVCDASSMTDIDVATRSQIQSISQQISVISTLRDALVHRGGYVKENGDIAINNEMTAKSFEAIEYIRLELQNIKDAAEDLHRIYWQLHVLRVPQLLGGLREDIQNGLYGPWRYKPALPSKPGQQHPRDAQGRLPHRGS